MSNKKLFYSKLKPLLKTTSKFKNFLISLILILSLMIDHIQIISYLKIKLLQFSCIMHTSMYKIR